MLSSILVPLDASEFSEDALPLARVLARRLGADLHLAHVIRPAPDAELKSPADDLEWVSRVRDGADAYLSGLAEEEPEIRTRTAVLEGRPVKALADYVRDEGISLVVMTSHGSGGLERWWLGSVADGLLRRSESHLLVVRPWDDTEDRPGEEPRFTRIVVPLDGSEVAESALVPALELARVFEAGVTLMRVVPAPVELTSVYGVEGVRVEGGGYRERVDGAQEYLGSVAQSVDGEDVDVRVVEEASPAEGVIQGSKGLGADLIVLSSHGRGGLARVVLGSVADKIVRGSTLPVLVVRPEVSEEEGGP